MRRFNCIIVDDEPIARGIIEAFCRHFSMLDVVGSCENALAAKSLLAEKEVDILFLDIDMPELDGLSFLKTLTIRPQVIFTTAYKEYALDAFDQSVCDYLLKPIPLQRFIVAVDKAVKHLSRTPENGATDSKKANSDFLFLKSDGKLFRINNSDLLFAEAGSKKIKITTNQGTLHIPMAIAMLEQLLPKSQFVRVHRSFIINVSKINYIEGNRVYINSNAIPIGDYYREGMMKKMEL